MKHEIAGEWNGNETNVIARDTRRARMNATAMPMPMASGAVARAPDNALSRVRSSVVIRPRELFTDM